MSNALRIENLVKRYSNGVEAVRDISFIVQEGDFFALLGPNGAGKSTIIGILSSLVNKTSGKVTVFDVDIDVNFSKAKQYLGIVPQEFNFNVFEPIEEILANQAGFYGIPRQLAYERAEIYLRKLGLWEKRRDSARQLSGGMKRRLMIARALVHEPRLLILDEPTAGVDIEIRRSMWDYLRELNEKGTSIILTTHYLEEAESLCRNIAIIDKGKIIENTTIKQLIAKANNETFIFDLRAQITALPEIRGCRAHLVDAHTIELEVPKTASLNDVFAILSNAGISVTSMRNKTNRLEQLFLDLVSSNKNN